MPVHCVSDNWSQFRSEEFAHFLKMNGVKHVRVAPYHAASNGRAERMVQSFKKHVKACKRSKLSIQRRFANFLVSYRSTRHPTTGRTPERPQKRGHLVARLDSWAKRTKVLRSSIGWQQSVETSCGSRETWLHGQGGVRTRWRKRVSGQTLEVPWAIAVRLDISGQPQVPPDAPEGVSAKTDSARGQEQEVTPAVTLDGPATASPQSLEAASTPVRRSSRPKRAWID